MDQAAIKVAWRREGKEEEKVFSILPTADALWKFIFHAPVIPYIGQILSVRKKISGCVLILFFITSKLTIQTFLKSLMLNRIISWWVEEGVELLWIATQKSCLIFSISLQINMLSWFFFVHEGKRKRYNSYHSFI